MDNKEELISYLQKRLSYLKKKKLSHFIFAVRNKNQGKIEELEDMINRIETDNFANPDYD